MKKEKVEFISIVIYFLLLITSLILLAFMPSICFTIVFGIVLVVGYFLIHLIRSILYSHTCPVCNKSFKINVFKDIFSSSSKLGKKIKCPHCKEKSWMKDE